MDIAQQQQQVMSKQMLGRAAPGTSRRVTKGEAIPLTVEKGLGERGGFFAGFITSNMGCLGGLFFTFFPKCGAILQALTENFKSTFLTPRCISASLGE